MSHRGGHLRFVLVHAITASILVTPVSNLLGAEPSRNWKEQIFDGMYDAWEVTKDASAKGWKYSKGTAVTAYKVTANAAAPVLAKARDISVDAAQVAWVYSTDRADDAWEWVKDRSYDTTEWVSDKAGRAWAVGRDRAGQAYVWTKVKLADSGAVSYVQTKLDDGWRWTTDKSGKTWVWVQDHAVEIGVVAAVVAAFAACLYFTEPGKPSPCSYQAIRESLVGKHPTQLRPQTVDAIAKQHFDTTANGNNYRRLFTNLRKIPDGFEVHHAYPQKYETTMQGAGLNIHNPMRLQGVDPQTHQAITRDWSVWDRGLGRAPTASEIMDFKNTIDAKYSGKLLEVGK